MRQVSPDVAVPVDYRYLVEQFTALVPSAGTAGGRPSTEADGVDHASVVNFVPRGWTLSARMLTRPEVSRPRRRRRPVSHGEGQRHARPRPRLRTRKYSFG